MTTTNDRTLAPVYWALRLSFGIVPIVAGLDKFTNLLVQWDKYVAPAVVQALPFSAPSFMHLAGIVEIVAGIGVLIPQATRLFAGIVAAWLWLIALNLILAGYYDIAVRDLVLGISSACLSRIAVFFPAGERRAISQPAHA
jgi:uncharacterized membrane protein YphA (DoxX/SURF4 family)